MHNTHRFVALILCWFVAWNLAPVWHTSNADDKRQEQSVDRAANDVGERSNRRRSGDSLPIEVHQRVISKSNSTYRIQVAESVRNQSVTIANVGTEIVVNPRLVVNDKRNWFSTRDILAGITKPGMSDREKSIAIWQFLVRNRYHDRPAHSGIEMHDPVRFLNVYGYGFCDDSATNFVVLAEQAGIKARVWGLEGHVVPEAYFEGGWRMLDPDGEIYYLEDDGQAIASVETLAQRPDLIRKYRSPYYTNAENLVRIYTSTENNRVSDWQRRESSATHTMAYDLRPGESLARFHHNWGLYYLAARQSGDGTLSPMQDLSHPAKTGNGRFIFEPVFENNVFQKGAVSVNNLRALQAGSDWLLASEDEEGTIAYRFASPYPYLDGLVSIRGRGTMSLAYSDNGNTWKEIWSGSPDEIVKTTVSIKSCFHNHDLNPPTYVYYLKLNLKGQIAALKFQSDIQIAPAALPALETGENRIRYLDDSEGCPPP